MTEKDWEGDSTGSCLTMPSEGDSDEIDWADSINGAFIHKVEKLKGYKKLRDYWLLIYEDLTRHHIEDDKAIKYLLTGFSRMWQGDPLFSRLFIRTASIIMEIEVANGTVRKYGLTDF